MKRGEVWWIELDPVRDGEILKTRLCVIVSPDVMIEGLRTVLVAPIAASAQASSFRPPVTVKDASGVLLLDQIRTIDKKRLSRCLGEIDRKTTNAALGTLREMFAE